MNPIGKWMKDEAGLPCFEYTGDLPYKAPDDKGQKIKLPEDPWFILGNYRMTLFSHVSGQYELISGQRSWMRLNKCEGKTDGKNTAEVMIDGKNYLLTGMSSSSAYESSRRIHGCGFAFFEYLADGIRISRNLSVKPSLDSKGGASAFLLTACIKNDSTETKEIKYLEKLGYDPAEIHESVTKTESERTCHSDGNTGMIGINTISDDPLLFGAREDMSVNDGYPPAVFMRAISGDVRIDCDENELIAETNKKIHPGEEFCFSILIGFSYDDIDAVCSKMDGAVMPSVHVCAYAEEWKKVLPDFKEEQDDDLRRELIWHAYTLEAMAIYSEYYDETKIPQGTIYDYYWGQHASARDNFQHALPLVYYNQPLAKSVLRYMLKRTTPFGEIRLIEYGFGYAENERYFTSDQQLYFFMFLSEYLRVTGDYEFLEEEITPYPVKGMAAMKVSKLVEKCFIFLRDTIGVGEHGLVRLLNSDWNDAVYYIIDAPYNIVFRQGESHMNSAMAISILQTLIPQLEASGVSEVEALCRSMSMYRAKVLSAFLKDMGDRAFPRRMYFDGRPFGEENMFLEPQGFTLQISELSDEYRRKLYDEMKKRLYDGEKIGAREQQSPEFDDDGFDKGSRENGGFWWALNGPVILGVSMFDKDEACRLLKQMTLKNLSEEYPQYWSSYWSAADTLESSLIPGEGCTDQSDDFWKEPVFCAHPHAWILYCYYRLREV